MMYWPSLILANWQNSTDESVFLVLTCNRLPGSKKWRCYFRYAATLIPTSPFVTGRAPCKLYNSSLHPDVDCRSYAARIFSEMCVCPRTCRTSSPLDRSRDNRHSANCCDCLISLRYRITGSYMERRLLSCRASLNSTHLLLMPNATIRIACSFTLVHSYSTASIRLQLPCRHG